MLEQNKEVSFTDCYELQMIDCNCNNCVFMNRDLEKYKYWHDLKKQREKEDFEKAKVKAIQEAQNVIDIGIENEDINTKKSGEGMMRVALKMKWFFEKKWLFNYAKCTKFNKDISFIPMQCQIHTQQCFKHRRDAAKGL